MPPARKKQRIRGPDGRFQKSPTTTAPEPATTRLLSTTEILETILKHLPMRDLLLSQRTCHLFRTLIRTSPTLQRCLFLQPVPINPLTYLDWRYDDKNMYPPSLSLGLHIRGAKRNGRPKTYPRHWGQGRDDAGRFRVFVNPLLREKFEVLKYGGLYFREGEAGLGEAMGRREASWRGMLVTQPAVGSLVVECDNADDVGEESDEEGDEDEDEEDQGHVNAPVAPGAGPLTPSQVVPAPVMPNAAGNGGVTSVDWTVSCFSASPASKGMRMQELFWYLEDYGRPAWIDGRDLWEDYTGMDDLERVVVRKTTGEEGAD